MERTKRIVISDIHLSSAERYKAKDAWFVPATQTKRLMSTLKQRVLNRADEVKDLIVLGDAFDNWVCPADQVPPTYEAIFAANGHILDLLKQIVAAGVGVFYTNGNHDFDLQKRELVAAVPGIRHVRAYVSGRIYAEHGHDQTLFNQVDYQSDPAFGRPIGYFITRALTGTKFSGKSPADILSYVDDILESLTPFETVGGAAIEAVTERVGMKPTDKFKMPGGAEVSIEEVKQRYKNLGQQYGSYKAAKRAFRDLRGLDGAADEVSRDRSCNVVLFGHTHHATLDKDTFLVEDRIYANSGTWCEGTAHYVEVDKGDEQVQVEVHEVDAAGKSVKVEKAEIEITAGVA